MIMAAAVADYRPAEALATKRPKDRAAWTVELEPTTDVLAELGRARVPGQVLVGFAADQGQRGLERAREKLHEQERRPRRLQRRGARRHRLRRAGTTRSTLVSGAGERTRRRRRRRTRSRRRSWTRWSAWLAEPAGAPAPADLVAAIAANLAPGRPRAGRDAAARRALPRRRGPPDHRGLPRRREDDAREGARPLARLPLLAAPVHARPAAVRRHGRQRLRPADERVRVPARARCSRTSCSSTR